MRNEKIRLQVPGQQTGPATLTVYIQDALSVAADRTRPMVVVVPGGGYRMCSDREMEPVAIRFLAMGYHACTLDYSVAPNRFPVALQELALAVATVRQRAGEWHVDPHQVFVCGFSAGGHLSGSLGALWERQFVWEPVTELLKGGGTGDPAGGDGGSQEADAVGADGREARLVRPDGLILCYPVITSGEYRHKGSFEMLLGENPDPERMEQLSLEKQVTASMPPVFLWHTVTDDTVPVENSLLLAAALRRAGVSFEMHLYSRGRHGLSLATEETAGSRENSVEPSCQNWISLVQSWLERRQQSVGIHFK